MYVCIHMYINTHTQRGVCIPTHQVDEVEAREERRGEADVLDDGEARVVPRVHGVGGGAGCWLFVGCLLGGCCGEVRGLLLCLIVDVCVNVCETCVCREGCNQGENRGIGAERSC